MKDKMGMESYLKRGIKGLIDTAYRASVSNFDMTMFLTRYERKREKKLSGTKSWQMRSAHIPPIMIASIVDKCESDCKVCNFRNEEMLNDYDYDTCEMLSSEEWEDIFNQADDLLIQFIVLTGGEPMLRKGVLKAAARHPDIFFPVLTSGALMNRGYVKAFVKYKNLIPFICLEGEEDTVDKSRGFGTLRKLVYTMELMAHNHVFFGVYITVTKENLEEVTNKDFITMLQVWGCRGIIYMEYMPKENYDNNLALKSGQRYYLNEQIKNLKSYYDDFLLISFPGDEVSYGTCLGAGRGLFHINSTGDVQPCIQCEQSDVNIRDVSLREALKSPFFQSMQDRDLSIDQQKRDCPIKMNQKEII